MTKLLASLLIFFTQFFLIQSVEEKISHVNILLPWSKEGTDDLLTGGDREMVIFAKPGCFVWTSSNAAVATIEPLYRNDTELNNLCSSKAVVKAKWHQKKRARTMIKAQKKDISTGVLGYDLRCEVWVAPIQSITIMTTVRKLSLGTTEKLEVQAFDDGNNVFSSLAGLRFQWAAPNRDILSILRLSETKVDATHSQREMERRGMLTDSVQIEGVKTGRGNITVKLHELGYEEISLATVDINVSRPLELEPKNARYVSPSSELQMELYTYDKSVYKQITMPTSQYKWETSDGSVVSINPDNGLLVGLEKGTSDIIARDQEITENQDTHTLDVSIPSSMQFAIVPAEDELLPTTIEQSYQSHITDSRIWYLVKGKNYVIRIILKDEEHRTMYITKNMEFTVKYGLVETPLNENENAIEDTSSSSSSSPSSSSKTQEGAIATNPSLPPSDYALNDRIKGRDEWNVQRRWVKATTVGRTMVSGVMLPVKSTVQNTIWESETEIQTKSVIVISNQIEIDVPTDPTPILLPPLEENYQVVAKGGTGNYLWSSADSEVASIGPTGNITCDKEEGITEINIEDELNKNNNIQANVEITKVADIIFMSGPIEAEVDLTNEGSNSNGGDDDIPSEGINDLYLHVGAVDQHRRLFHSCKSIAKDIITTMDDNNKIFSLIETYVGPSPRDLFINTEDSSKNDDDGDDEEDDATGTHDAISKKDRLLYQRSCVTLRLRPLRAGATTLHVKYNKYRADVTISAFPKLQWIIPGPSNDGTHTAVVSLHATATVQLVGGPQPRGHSLGRNSVDEYTLDDPSIARISETDLSKYQNKRGDVDDPTTTSDAFAHIINSDGSRQDGRIYSIFCRALGHTKITFTVSNDRRALISDDMQDVKPMESKMILHFICADPHSTQVIMQQTATVDTTPTSEDEEEPSYYVRTLAPVPIYVRVLDQFKRPFLNFSTVATQWLENQNIEAKNILDLAYRRCAQNQTLLNSTDEYGNIDIHLYHTCDQHGPTGLDGRYQLHVMDKRDFIVVELTNDPKHGHSMLERQYIFGYEKGTARITVVTEVCPNPTSHTIQSSKKEDSKTPPPNCPEDPLRRSARLQLVPNVQLVPRHYTLFRTPNNILNVEAIGGTRQFSFNFNNPQGDIAELNQITKFEVELDPKSKNGQVTVEVKDIGLTETVVAKTDVIVSDVLALEIRIQGDKIAKDASEPLHLRASTFIPNKWFPKNQLSKMNITFEDASATHVSISMHPCSLGSTGENVDNADSETNATTKSPNTLDNDKRDFCITGIKIGTTEIRAYITHADGKKVYSAPLSITIFEPLSLQPRRLVLLPGSIFDIDHHGGPKTKLIYESSNKSIVTVTNKGLVTELDVGECIISVKARGLYALTGQKVTHARDAILVSVVLLQENGIEIVSPSRKILVGNEMKLRIRGINDESPFTFGTSNIKYTWSTDKKEVLSLNHHGRYEDHDVDSSIERDYFVWATAQSVGKSKITVTVVTSPKGESIDGRVIKYKTLQLVAELIVYVELPLVLHSPSTLLMWPASLARIHTNNDHGNTQLIYKQSVVDSGFPEMIHFIGKEKCNGKIQAGTVPGRTTVYVFNQQQDQSLSINIEIKEISQLLIQGDTNLYVDEEQELDVVVVDDLGRPFSMDVLKVNYILNKEDFIIKPGTTRNSTFKVLSKAEGEIIIKFYIATTGPPEITVSIFNANELSLYNTALPPKVTEDGTADVIEAHTYLSDYVTLRSVYRIVPGDDIDSTTNQQKSVHVHIGGQIQFESKSKNQKWSSSNKNILNVNKKTGHTTGKQVGHGYVKHYGTTAHLINRASVTVSKVSSIVMNSTSQPFIVPSIEYTFPIAMFNNDQQLLKDTSSIEQNIRLECRYDMNTKHSGLLSDSTVQVSATLNGDACVVKIIDTSTSWNEIEGDEDEFPTAKSISLIAIASDKLASDKSIGSRGTSRTYQYIQQLPNKIMFMPNMRIRVRYPDDLVSIDSTNKLRRGKVLLGCVELQPKTPFAYLEVYVRLDLSDVPLEISRPPEITIDQEGSEQDPIGWMKYTYKIAARNREVPFKEVEVLFIHGKSNQEQDVHVTYGQKHEHQWYCAVKDGAIISAHKRKFCKQCPMDGGGRVEDLRERDIRCCLPNAGDICTNELTTDSYHCNGSPKPPTDCGDFDLGTRGEDIKDERDVGEDWDNVSDSNLSISVIGFIVVLITILHQSGSLWNFLMEFLRSTFCNKARRDVGRNNGIQGNHFGRRHQDIPGGENERRNFQRRDSNIVDDGRRVPVANNRRANPANDENQLFTNW